MSYVIGEHFWVPDDEHAWLYGTLTEFKNSVLEFTTPKGTKKYRVNDLKSKLEPCGSHVNDNVENLVDLDELSEGAILHHIRNRFHKKLIYTHVGSILVAVNPFEALPIYSEREIRRANESSQSYPHVFVTAAVAYQQLRNNEKNQSVLISGESGAGKTETTKKVLTFLANVAPDSKPKVAGEPGMENKILQSNPLLEALGNAKTLRNNNSSRFGKWMKVGFDRSFRIQGCEIVNYLLEKSRIVSQSANERNYHIFYQMLAGADSAMKGRLYLRPPEQFSYLNLSGCVRIEGVDDAAEFQEVLGAMSTLQFPSSTIESIFRGIAGLLHLGNIKFESSTSSDNSKVTAASSDSVRIVGELFGVDNGSLNYALVEKKMQMSRRGSVVSIALTMTQAEDSRDTIAKFLYSNLFDWVIARVNSTLRTEEPPFSIGILDIFGFEVFEVNSFEQMCINYANEKLQYHFNEVIFSVERALYEDEGVSLEQVVFEDNNDCVNLLEGRPYGLISLLEEECSLGNGSDLSYINKLEKNFGTGKPAANKFFVKHKTKPEYFTVLHFAGGVEYNVHGFLDKNRDSLSNTCREMMLESQIPLLAELFQLDNSNSNNHGNDPSKGTSDPQKGTGGGGGDPQKGGKQSTKSTLGTQFRNQLIGLVANLRLTEPLFIRCVKPNHQKVPSVLDGTLALRQMRYAGLFEAIRIRKSGFAYRSTFNSFANQYQILVDGLSLRRASRGISDREACVAILSQCSKNNVIASNVWQVGTHSRVFLKNNSDRMLLERIRTAKISTFILRLQAAIRSFLLKCRLFKERNAVKIEQHRLLQLTLRSQHAAVRIQKHWRRKMVQSTLKSMSSLLELRRVLSRREIHKIRELLGRIERDFNNTPAMAGLTSPAGISSHNSNKASNSNSNNKLPKSALKSTNNAFSSPSTASASASASASTSASQAGMVLAVFEREIKVARVMLKLIEVQDTLIEELQTALDNDNPNVADLNRLILKAERLEMSAHPLVLEAKTELLKLFNKRRVMKALIAFLQNEDEFNESILSTISEARQLAIDKEFVDKVQSVYENAGPRLKTRNKLRSAVEILDRFAIEQAVLEVMEIRKHHGQFGEAELRAAKMALRMMTFDAQLYPTLRSNRYKLVAGTGAGAGGGGGYDANELNMSVAEGEDTCSHIEQGVVSLWGCPILAEQSPTKLTAEIIEICNAITEATFPAIVKMHKQRLQQAVNGQVDEMFAAIRYFKWTKTICTWRYPEVMAGAAKSATHRSNHDLAAAAEEAKQKAAALPGDDPFVATEEEFFGLRFREARSAAFIVRSLHQDFDPITTKASSALMEAALSSVDLHGASMKDTLQRLEKSQMVDEDRRLPNGMIFNKTVTRRAATASAASGVNIPASGGMKSSMTATSTPVKGNSTNDKGKQQLSASKSFNGSMTGGGGNNSASKTMPHSPPAAGNNNNSNNSSARQVMTAAWANMTTTDAFADKQRQEKRGPLPSVPVRRVEDLDDEDPMKILHKGRQRKAKELKRMEDDLTRIKRNLPKGGWK